MRIAKFAAVLCGLGLYGVGSIYTYQSLSNPDALPWPLAAAAVAAPAALVLIDLTNRATRANRPPTASPDAAASSLAATRGAVDMLYGASFLLGIAASLVCWFVGDLPAFTSVVVGLVHAVAVALLVRVLPWQDVQTVIAEAAAEAAREGEQ